MQARVRRIFVRWIVLGLALAPAGAAAMGLVVISDDRSVSNRFSDGTPSASQTPGPGQLDWSGSVPLASQTSVLGADGFGASAQASVFSDIEFGGGVSTFDVTFEVTEAITADFDASFGGDDEAFASLSFRAALTRGSDTLFEERIGVDELAFLGSPVAVVYDAVLDPGTYRLLVELRGSGGNGSAFYDFDFRALPVPEPSTGVLVSLGLVTLSASGSRRSRAASRSLRR